MKFIKCLRSCFIPLLGLSASYNVYAHDPSGQTYRVEVFSSFGTQFQDCFAFDKFNKVDNLTVAGFGSLTARHDQLNNDLPTWQAVSTTGQLFNLAFHGTVGGSGGQTIQANGVNEFGDTFILQGVSDRNCILTLSATAKKGEYRK